MGGGHHQRVAVGRRAGQLLGKDRATRSGFVFDHHGLFPFRAQRVAQHAGQDVGGAAGREGHDQADGMIGEGLGARAQG
ncbi:hypothetical protein D9M69_714530 [compost metagenome]